MIILIVNENYVLTLEAESQPPIAAHIHGPMTSKLTFQGMQVVAGGIHIAGPAGHVQSSKQPPQTLGVGGLDAGFGASFGEEPKAFVPVALNHSYSVYEHYTMGKRE
jgi:hypothetical protein